MKVGDLVRWTHPDSLGLGIIMPMPDGFDLPGGVYIAWIDEPRFNGPYPAVHKYLELINESR